MQVLHKIIFNFINIPPYFRISRVPDIQCKSHFVDFLCKIAVRKQLKLAKNMALMADAACLAFNFQRDTEILLSYRHTFLIAETGRIS